MAAEEESGPLGVLDPVVSSWDEGIAAIRNRAKWLLVGLGAIAALFFGTAPLVSRPTLSWSANWVQLLLAAVVAILGLWLLAIVAKEVADVFKPVTSSLSDLDPVTEADFDAHREEYFGPRATLDPAQQQLRDANRTVLLLEHALAGARGTQKTDLAGALREARARQVAVTAGVEALLEFDRYNKVVRSRSLSNRTFQWAFGAVVAGVLFQLILSAAPADEDSADGSGTAGSATVSGVAQLTRPADDSPALPVWDALQLPACTTSESDGVIVVVTGGSGSIEAPYRVQTIPEAADGEVCPRISFTVPAAFFPVEAVPEEITIKWPTEEPEQSPEESD